MRYAHPHHALIIQELLIQYIQTTFTSKIINTQNINKILIDNSKNMWYTYTQLGIYIDCRDRATAVTCVTCATDLDRRSQSPAYSCNVCTR